MDKGPSGCNVNAAYVSPHMAGRVLITQLSGHSSTTGAQASKTGGNPESHVISKILLKAVIGKPKASSKTTKKDPKTFVLRNINTASVTTCDKLKEVISSQFNEDITLKDFDVGYYQGSTVVTIRNSQDLGEIWQEVRKGNNIVLWCDGLRDSTSRKRKHVPADSDSEDELPSVKRSPAVKEREKRLEETLLKRHEHSYTMMQLRIWAEMYIGGYHKSLDDPPTTSMFSRAGSGDSQKRKTSQESVVETVTQEAKQISSALSPPPQSMSSSVGTSPARAIESRSKCYKQLIDLKNLNVSGILSDEEYQAEKGAIMMSLKKLH